MSVTAAVRIALTKGGKKQAELARAMGIHRQSMYLKMVKERWTGAELAKVAEFTGGKLVFLYPDGQQIPIETTEQETEKYPDGQQIPIEAAEQQAGE